MINSPEGNRDAGCRTCSGNVIDSLMNRLFIASEEVKTESGNVRETEVMNYWEKPLGLLHGNMGKANVKRLSGFGVEVIFL